MSTRAVVQVVAWVTLSACGGASMMAPGNSPGVEDPQHSLAPPHDVWELVRPGQPTLRIELRGDTLLLAHEQDGITSVDTLARGADARFVAPIDHGLVADEAASTSCVEVVAVESDALVVRVGVMTNGQCVLSDEVLRFAKQAQR